MNTLDSFLPPHWSRNNPVDILGDADPARFARAVETVSKDPNADGMLLITAPQGLTDPTATAEILKPYAKSTGKPMLASFMGGPTCAPVKRFCNRVGIPTFPFPDGAARAFNYMWKYSYSLRSLYETPMGREAHDPDRIFAEKFINDVRQSGRAMLTEFESKQVLAAYGIPIVDTRIAATEDEAVATAEEIGFPVVLKLYSKTITHKTDVGGVQLNIRNADGVRIAWRAIEAGVAKLQLAPAQAVAPDSSAADSVSNFLGVTVQPMIALEAGYELIIGSTVDPQFGPVLLFGSGGQLVEVYQDRASALPPLNTTLARRMMERTKIYEALQGHSRTQAGRSRRARTTAGTLQPTGRRAAMGAGDRHQSAAGLARTDCWR